MNRSVGPNNFRNITNNFMETGTGFDGNDPAGHYLDVRKSEAANNTEQHVRGILIGSTSNGDTIATVKVKPAGGNK